MTFHGWIQIQLAEIETASGADDLKREEEAIAAIHGKIGLAADSISLFRIERGGNGMLVLTAHGVRNHRNEQAIDLFRWVESEFPDSFGLLHVWDDEHPDYENCFRVYRCALGACTEMDDPHLSPCVPTIEAPYQQEAEGAAGKPLGSLRSSDASP
jgi:PAS domain-containing protein